MSDENLDSQIDNLIERIKNDLNELKQKKYTNLFQELQAKTTPIDYYENPELDPLLSQIRREKKEQLKKQENPYNISIKDRLQTPKHNPALIQELKTVLTQRKPKKPRKQPKIPKETTKPRIPKPGDFAAIHQLLEQTYGKGIFY